MPISMVAPGYPWLSLSLVQFQVHRLLQLKDRSLGTSLLRLKDRSLGTSLLRLKDWSLSTSLLRLKDWSLLLAQAFITIPFLMVHLVIFMVMISHQVPLHHHLKHVLSMITPLSIAVQNSNLQSLYLQRRRCQTLNSTNISRILPPFTLILHHHLQTIRRCTLRLIRSKRVISHGSHSLLSMMVFIQMVILFLHG